MFFFLIPSHRLGMAGLQEEDAQSIAEGLKHNEKLANLEYVVSILFKGNLSQENIFSFRLYANEIGQKGALYLSESLKKNKTLKKLG